MKRMSNVCDFADIAVIKKYILLVSSVVSYYRIRDLYKYQSQIYRHRSERRNEYKNLGRFRQLDNVVGMVESYIQGTGV